MSSVGSGRPAGPAFAADSASGRALQPRGDHRAQSGLGNGGAAIATTVKVAIPLSPDEIAGLQRSLEQYVGRPVTLDVEIDPEIIGGVWVRIGDAVIDGSLRARLESLRQHLCAQCRVILTTGIPAIETESRV